jgi:pimeloyl-ACP methyl ester carboxylesterase
MSRATYTRAVLLAAAALVATLTTTGGLTATAAYAARRGAAAAGSTYGNRCSTQNSPVTGLVKQAHPVVLVHGWTGSAMESTRSMLEKRLKSGWQFLLFDYHDAATLWASDDRIAGCLADYIHTVSQAHIAAGGDGMVYLVAHSMGGLAARFAAAKGDIGTHIGGLVTLATPSAGSPWGNANSGAWARMKEITSGYAGTNYPPETAQAKICLALHQGAKGMPAGCAVAPYLPGTTPVDQVVGLLTLHRRAFGVFAYDLPIGGDTVVDYGSAQGYIGSAAAGKVPTHTHVGAETVQCGEEFNSLLSYVRDPGTRTTILGDIAQLFVDSTAMNAIVSNSVSPALIEILGASNLIPHNCSHGQLATNKTAVDDIAADLRSQAELRAGPPATQQILLNILDSNGRLKPSYTTDSPAGYPVDCSYDDPSPVAVSSGTHSCGSVADNTFACWLSPATAGLMCLPDPWSTHVMYRRVAAPLATQPAPAQSWPFGIELDDGSRWWFRIGGAWPSGPANAPIPMYGCESGCAIGEEALVAKDGTRGGADAFVIKNGSWYVMRAHLALPPDVPKLAPAKLVHIKKIWFITTGSNATP